MTIPNNGYLDPVTTGGDSSQYGSFTEDMVMACLCSGLISGGQITTNAGGQGIDITLGIGAANDHSGTAGLYGTVAWGAFTNAAPAGDGDNFVAVHIDGSLDIALTRQALATHVYLGHFWAQGGYVLAVFPVSEWAGHFIGRINEWISHGVGGLLTSGSCVTTSTGVDLSIGSGEGYFRAGEFAFNLSTDFTKMYVTSGVWAVDTSDPNEVGTVYWNNITTGLVPLTADYWTKHLLIAIPDHSGGTYHLITGQAEYATEAEAIAGPNPSIPEAVQADSANIYTIVVQEASLDITGGITRVAPVMADMFGRGSASPGGSVVHSATTLRDAANSHPAAAITYTPAGAIAATDIQAAITELDSEKAPAAQGVTNGDSHDHSGGDGAQIAYSGLSGIPSTFAPASHDNTAHSATYITSASLPVGGTPALTLGTTNTAGASPNFLRRDDTILAFDATNPAALGTAAPGVATVAARRDHVHTAPTTVSGSAGSLAAQYIDWNSGSGGNSIANKPTITAGTVTSVTAGDGMTQSGTASVNPTLNIVSHAGTAGTIGTVNIGADAIGVNLGSTSTTACSGADARLSDARTPSAHNQAESTITFTDISTGNASTSAHGYFPKLPTSTGKFLKDDLTWATIAGGGDMLGSNNLSDVSSAPTALSNLIGSYTGNTLKAVRVNAGETDLEYYTPSAGGGGDGGFSLPYAFDTATTNTPAAGEIRYDNATPGSATQLFVNETAAASVAVDTYLDGLFKSDYVMVSNADKSKYHVFQLSDNFTSGAGVDTLPVAYLFGVGTFSDSEAIYLSFARSADILTLSAGTATVPPLTMTAGTNKTTATAGIREYDGKVFYSTPHAANRGVDLSEQFISLTANYTLTSQTGAQKAFNTPTNGALTVEAATTYFFEGSIYLTSLSATSGSFGFAFGGTATLTSQGWSSTAKKTTVGTAATAQTTYNTAANTTLATASTTTSGWFEVKGIVRVNAAGTLIPMVSLGVAAAAVVNTNSFFRLRAMGTNTATNVGDWS